MRQRDSSAEFTSKYGFSVVAPTSDDGPVLDGRQQRVLLRLVEAVDLVEEEDRRARRSSGARCCARSITARTSARPAFTADASSKAARAFTASSRASVVLPGPGRPVQDHRVGPALLDRGAQRGPAAEQVLLADELAERARPHPCRERQVGRRYPGLPSG